MSENVQLPVEKRFRSCLCLTAPHLDCNSSYRAPCQVRLCRSFRLTEHDAHVFLPDIPPNAFPSLLFLISSSASLPLLFCFSSSSISLLEFLVECGLCVMQGAADGASGMSLPFEPVTLTFNELHYLVPLPPQQADSPNAVDGPNGRELELLKVINAFLPEQVCLCWSDSPR